MHVAEIQILCTTVCGSHKLQTVYIPQIAIVRIYFCINNIGVLMLSVAYFLNFLKRNSIEYRVPYVESALARQKLSQSYKEKTKYLLKSFLQSVYNFVCSLGTGQMRRSDLASPSCMLIFLGLKDPSESWKSTEHYSLPVQFCLIACQFLVCAFHPDIFQQ